ncbi:MAG: OB-fold nucleic acid binding domain-containing protein [Candidatus Odinarchaeia archaeon]
MESKKFARSSFKRIHIEDILQGFIQDEENPTKMLLDSGEAIHRIKVLGLIVNKFTRGIQSTKVNGEFSELDEVEYNPYSVIELDDGTGVIAIKAWGEEAITLEKFKIGDLVEIIGKPRIYQGIPYLLFESGVKITNLHWFLLHELAILKDKNEKNRSKPLTESVDINKTNNIIKENTLLANEEQLGYNHKKEFKNQSIPIEIEVLNIISENDINGISIHELSLKIPNITIDDLNKILDDLIKDGLIYEAAPKVYKKI